MRLRIAVAASLLAALVVIVIPGVATARIHHHPRHNDGLTINATPNPISTTAATMPPSSNVLRIVSPWVVMRRLRQPLQG